MVVFMVNDSRLFAKMRTGAQSGVSGAEQRTNQRWRSHFARSDARRRFLKYRAEQRALRVARREFFKNHAADKLQETCASLAQSESKLAIKSKINTIIGINKRVITRDNLLSYMDNKGRFPTRRMAQRYARLGRIATAKFLRQQKRALRRKAKESNIYLTLHQYGSRNFVEPADDCPGLPGPIRTLRAKISDFNPKQNFAYKSKHNIVPHPYAGLNLRQRLEAATIIADIPQLKIIDLCRARYERDNLKHAIAYRNLFKKFIYACGHERIMSIIEQFDGRNKLVDIQPQIIERNKLRNKLLRKKLNIRKMVSRQVPYSDLFAIPEMENDDAHGDGSLQQIQSQNVILTDARDSSGADIPRIPKWYKMNTEDVVGNYSEMVERWHVADVLSWSTKNAKETKLSYMHLPNAILANPDLKNLISLRPFYNHRLWRGDMEIKVEVNSNKFQVGQLQVSFYYGLEDLRNSDQFKNVVTLSQCNHGLIDAGGSNSVTLNIPYKNHSVMLPTCPINDIKQLYMGTLCVFVLNKLRTVTGAPDHADVVVNFRFKNCEFSGQIPASMTKFVAMPEMEAFAMAGAMKLLDTALSDNNRDNPPAVLPGQYVVPTATHSWSIGTGGAEPIQTLRLDQSGQTHHPNNSDLDSHSTVKDIVRTFTYMKQIEWSLSSERGSILDNWSVSPDYMKTYNIVNNTLVQTGTSALHVMSNQFMQWRGSIEYRFDVVASQFHTGRLLVAFMPLTSVNTPSLAELMSSPNIQYDLQESRSFTFVVPYVHIDAWMRRYAQMDGIHSAYTGYGTLYMFVLNGLNCPSTVSKTIDINVYVRAGTTFELAVPIQPSIGLSYVSTVYTPSDDLIPEADGMTDAYIGQWSGYNIDDCAIIRWGTLAGRVAEFPAYKSIEHSAERYYFELEEGLDFKAKVTVGTTPMEVTTCTIFFILKIGDYYVAMPASSINDAVAARALAQDGKINDIKNKYAMRIVSIASNNYHGSPVVLKARVFAGPENERELSTEILDPTRDLMLSNFGQLFFGESFARLKDLCRRYQLYTKLTWDPNNLDEFDGFHIVRIPIIPTGLKLTPFHDGKVDLLSNKCRDGMIPLILSGFRYYRGSIRFRIVFHDNDSNLSAWVQHRPEMVNEESVTFVRKHMDNLAVFAHGYASYLQSTKINNVIEVEFPFYQPGMYGILGAAASYSHRIYSSNGVALIGVKAGFTKKLYMTVHYCLGDDFNFNTFQGFPMMVNVANVADTAQYTGDNRINTLPMAWPQDETTKKQSLVGWLFGVDEMTENIKNSVSESLNEVVETYKNEGLWPGAKDFFCFVISQLVHVIVNFSIKTCAIAIVSIFSYIGTQIMDKIDLLSRFLSVIFKKFFPDRSEELNDQVRQNTTGVMGDLWKSTKREVNRIFAHTQDEINEDKESVAGWFSLCFTTLTSVMGCHNGGLKFDVNKAAGDFLNAKHFKAGTSVHTFIKLNYRVLVQMYDFIKRKIDPTYYIAKMFGDDKGIGQMWLTEVRELTTITLTSRESFEENFSDRVDSALLVGRELIESIAASDVNDLMKQLGGFERRFDRLTKIRNDLNRRGQYSYRRPKPMHVQVQGEPGIGKSILCDELSTMILREVCNFTDIPINKICSVKASSKFWDQCSGTEPVVLLDDLWACTQPDILSTQITNYVDLYGDTIFSPPKADVDEKNMRYAPTLIVSTTNHPWIVLPDVDRKAIWRRMDLLVKATKAPLDPEGNPGCDHCKGMPMDAVPHTHLSDFHHLRFTICDKMEFNTFDKAHTDMTWPQFKHYAIEFLRPRYIKNQNMYLDSVQRAINNATTDELPNIDEIENRVRIYKEQLEKELQDKYKSLGEEFGEYGKLFSAKTKVYMGELGKMFEKSKKFFKTASPEDETCEFAADLKPYMHDEIAELFNKFTAQERQMVIETIEEVIKNEIRNGKTAKLNLVALLSAGKFRTCKHMCQHIIGGTFRVENGKEVFVSSRNFHVTDSAQCQTWCVMNSVALLPWYSNYWINAKPTRRILFRKQNFAFLPKMCDPGIRGQKSFAIRVRDVMANLLDSQLKENSATRRTIRFVKYVLTSAYNMIMRWLPILLAIIGGATTLYAGYRAYGIHSETSGWLNERRTIIQNEGLEYLDKNDQQYTQQQRNEWIAAYTNNRLNRELAQRRKVEFDPSKYGYQPPVNMISFPEYNHYAAEAPRVPKIIGQKTVPKMAISQSGSQQLLVAQQRLKKNAVWIKTRYLDATTGSIVENKFLCNMLRARQMLSIRHYWERWESMPKDTEFYFTYVEDCDRMLKMGMAEGQIGIRINLLECERHKTAYEASEDGTPADDCNWDIIELPKQIAMAPDITKFIATRNMHNYVMGNIYFVRPGENEVHCLPMTRNPHRVAMAPVPGGQVLTMDESYLYARHAPGYCGSGILSGSLQRPIIGFHVAEWNNQGLAEPIYAEMFNTVPTREHPVIDVAEMPLLDVDLTRINIDTTLYPKGVVPEMLAASQSAESQFTPSIAHGEIYEVKTAPMPLGQSDPRCGGKDPLKLGCEKHGNVPLDFPRKYLKEAVEDYKDKILTLCTPVRNNVGVLTLQEAICGDPLIPSFTPLNWSSSEGFPLCNQRPPNVRGKTHLFNLENPMDGTGYLLRGLDPELARIYQMQMVMRKNGIRPVTIFINCLKDELRDIEKTNTPGKTRVFSTSPVQYIIPYRQYFGDFNAAFKTSGRIHGEHAIGINVDGPEWSELARYLQRQGKDIIAGDYSAFGDTLNNNVMYEAFEIMRCWYDKYSTPTEEDQIVRGVLISEAMSVKRLSKNYVYEALCGMASGFPATDILNSMVNCIYLRVAWLEITKTTMMDFNLNCNVITYGDDVLINVNEKFSQIYNTQSLQDFFAKYKIKFTDCDKTGAVVPLRTLETAPFLKRNFVRHPTRPMMYLAQIDEVSIGNCVNWNIAKDDPVDAFMCNASSALNLAYGHGPEYYERLRGELKKRISKEGKVFLSLSWTEYDARAYDQTNSL